MSYRQRCRFQAGEDWFAGLRLCGVTPWELFNCLFHRVCLTALHAEPLTPDWTRWNRLAFMTPKKAAAHRLAQVTLRGAWDFEPSSLDLLIDDFQFAVGQRKRWTTILPKAIAERFGGKRPALRALADFIAEHPAFLRFWEKPTAVCVNDDVAPVMRPAAGRPREWNVPAIATIGDLTRWLNLIASDLAWFADQRAMERQAAPKLCHYHRRWVRKRDGSFRLIEAPKQRLKMIQRAILKTILEKIPAHDAAHGFRGGRSILTFATPHSGKAMVLRMDLRDFFPTFSQARVRNLFLTAGYPEGVATSLAGLCTTICPRSAFHDLLVEHRRRARELYSRKHLPQGAPTSPMLANLCAFNLDCRLAGLAKAAGAKYSRYADDLVFSGDDKFARNINRFSIHVMAVALEEGFEVNARKTRIMRQGVRQTAAGLTVNTTPNISRNEYDRLKAILTNCARRGPAAENREAIPNFRSHLKGKIAHVAMVNSAKGEKLKTLFKLIPWPSL